jgi:Ribbon-helix-helix protein, copG family
VVLFVRLLRADFKLTATPTQRRWRRSRSSSPLRNASNQDRRVCDLEFVRGRDRRKSLTFSLPPAWTLDIITSLYKPTSHDEAKDKVFNFRIDADLIEGLHELRDRDASTMSESIRRAIRAYLIEKGIALKPPARKRRQGKVGS